MRGELQHSRDRRGEALLEYTKLTQHHSLDALLACSMRFPMLRHCLQALPWGRCASTNRGLQLLGQHNAAHHLWSQRVALACCFPLRESFQQLLFALKGRNSKSSEDGHLRCSRQEMPDHITSTGVAILEGTIACQKTADRHMQRSGCILRTCQRSKSPNSFKEPPCWASNFLPQSFCERLLTCASKADDANHATATSVSLGSCIFRWRVPDDLQELLHTFSARLNSYGDSRRNLPEDFYPRSHQR
mmetsp:Transcript_21898/g.51161  ORF Transcript_21898/g.51161 Transcript_21898/m.51161 type:complete len:246 (+) Transcript_21898:245-982(+)